MPKSPHSSLGSPDQFLARLQGFIKGQPEVLARLARAVLRIEYDTAPQRGCRGSFFFAGPTGVGKTVCALTLADFLFGPKRLFRFDCSELKTLDRVMGLLGDKGESQGRFGQAYRAVPKGVWLFDEIEKAHPEFVHLFLQMTDAGCLTLADGERLDLRDIYIIVTSNLGSAEILGREHLPFVSMERRVIRSVERHLRPELLARFGVPYVFRPLHRSVQAEIVAYHLGHLIEWHAKEHRRRLTYDPAVIQFLIQRGFSPRLGARPLLDVLREQVGDAIVANLSAGLPAHGRLTVEGNKLRLLP